MKKGFGIVAVIYFAILIVGLVGWGKCIYKACSCNWEPIGKAEVIYTVGACTGLGVIVGWIDIQDK
jgi:hypothetical protein